MTLRSQMMQFRPLVRAVQFAVTGEYKPRRWPLLAAEVAKEQPLDLLVDLGCGAAPLLEYVQPRNYVGIDADGGEIGRARKKFARPGYTFIEADLSSMPLTEFCGASVVTVSSVTHHLSDNTTVGLFERISADIAPKHIFLQDAWPTGPLGPLVTLLDAGSNMRTEHQLKNLLEGMFRIEVLWTYDNPVRSFHQFLLKLSPRH